MKDDIEIRITTTHTLPAWLVYGLVFPLGFLLWVAAISLVVLAVKGS